MFSHVYALDKRDTHAIHRNFIEFCLGSGVPCACSFMIEYFLRGRRAADSRCWLGLKVMGSKLNGRTVVLNAVVCHIDLISLICLSDLAAPKAILVWATITFLLCLNVSRLPRYFSLKRCWFLVDSAKILYTRRVYLYCISCLPTGWSHFKT